MAQINTDLETLKTARDNMKTALEEKGQTVTKDIRTYAEAISNISTGGSGDVKLFETVEEMQQDENPQEGDLAVVYGEEIQPINEESEFDSCIFPNTVVLDEAFTGRISGSFIVVDSSSGWFNGSVSMSSSSFRFDSFGETTVGVKYTSNDGITYTRTDGGEELQEFGTTIKWDSSRGSFNGVIGNFMKISGNYFDGLYQYKLNNHQDNVIQVADLTTYTTTMEDGHIKTFNVNDKLDIYFNLNDLKKVQNINNINYATFYVSTDNKLKMIIGQKSTYITNSSGNIIGLGIQNYNSSSTPICEVYDVNLDDYSLSNYTTYAHNEFPLYTRKVSWYKILDMKSYIFSTLSSGQTYQAEIVTENVSYVGYSNVVDLNVFKNEYIISKNQLDATSDYVYEKTLYGKNGVENGTLTTNVSNSFADVNAEVYAKIQAQYDNMQPRVLTDQDKDIDNDIRIIPSKSDGTSLLDTSNVTDMSNMFSSCKNLTNIPLLDTSNATNMKYMFIECENLITVPNFNTLNVTNMYGIFNGCKNLTIVPNFNTSNVTDMQYMFSDCNKLTTVPNLDTSNVTNMQYMFSYCKNLTTVPNFNTSKVTNMYYMFNSCNNLSNESLNNILAMCVNSALTANKKLKYIGLTQEQATTCTTLSNYQALVNAGWTTGY